MLQENSQKIRRYQIREAASVGAMWFLILGIIILLCGGFFCLTEWQWPSIKTITIALVVLGVIAIISFLYAFDDDVPTGDWLAKVEAGTVILDKESKKVVEVQNEDVILMKSHPIFSKRYEFLEIDGMQYFSVTVHPMTENPKVRDITCKLVLKIKEESCENLQTLFDFLHLHEMWKVGRDYGSEYRGKTEVVWEDPVRSMLYDFCNTNSRELSELFNPMRKEQQERFEKLVHAYFDPLLVNSGIVIERCYFSVS